MRYKIPLNAHPEQLQNFVKTEGVKKYDMTIIVDTDHSAVDIDLKESDTGAITLTSGIQERFEELLKNSMCDFLCDLRDYMRESNNNLAYDERVDMDFVETYFKEGYPNFFKPCEQIKHVEVEGKIEL